MFEEQEKNNKSNHVISENNDSDIRIPKTKEEIIQLLKTDVNKFNLVYPHLGWRIDLRGAHLREAWLEGVNLRGADLRGADLKGAYLTKADLTKADLTGVDLTEAEPWRDYLVKARLGEAKLIGAKLIGAKLRKAELRKVNLTSADLTGADLREVSLTEADLTEADLTRTNLTGTDLRGVSLRGADLTEAKLMEADLTEANLQRAKFIKTNLKKAGLRKSNLEGATFVEADLEEADLNEAKLINAELLRTNLQECDLRFANLENSKMDGADLRGAKFNDETKLKGANVIGVKIHKFNFEQLKDYGGLTNYKLRQMEIIYDLGILRQAFSGWMSTIHIVAFIMFVAPYGFYVLSQVAISEAITKSNSIESATKSKSYEKKIELNSKLHEQETEMKKKVDKQEERTNNELKEEIDKAPLLSFEKKEELKKKVEKRLNEQAKELKKSISIEGVDEGEASDPFCASNENKSTMWDSLVGYIRSNSPKVFIFLLFYNLARLALFVKTKMLEHKEIITGLTSDFTFEKNPRLEKDVGFIRRIFEGILGFLEIVLQLILWVVLGLIKFLESKTFIKLKKAIIFLEHFKENSKWHRLYVFMEVGLFFNVGFVLYHSYYFLTKPLYVLKESPLF